MLVDSATLIDYDIPDLIISLVNSYRNARTENEKLNLQIRLEKCRDYISESLKMDNKNPNSYFKKRK
jgi:hypothetical protein